MKLLIFLCRWLRQCITMLCLTLRLHQNPPCHYRTPAVVTRPAPIRCRAKPHWIRQEVIRLKALMPHDGCRTIANTFNRLYAERRKVTVGKTYVSNVIQQHRYEIRQTRHAIRNRKLKAQPKNRIWGIDLTQVRDTHQQTHALFGAIDHGTRACVSLRQIPGKASITLLRVLCDAVEHYGKPRAIRTDNEAVFTSRLFRFGLWLLGIKHQRTEKHCPWMTCRDALMSWEAGCRERRTEGLSDFLVP